MRILALITIGFITQAGVPPVRTMYNDTLAMEQKVRASMEAPDAPPSIVSDVHAVVAAYEALVRRYPASGYSDNALWQAGRLALDAFAAFGDAADREAGVKLLRRLAAGYPTSKLVAQVPDILARVNGADPAAARTAAAQARPAAARAPARVATIRDIRRNVLPDAVRITIELDGEVPFHDERISDPARVFVDLPGTRAAARLLDQTLRFNDDADLVRQVRIGRHPNSTTRVVVDAAGVTSYSVYPLYGPFRLVIDCVRPTTAVSTPPRGASPATPVATTFAPSAGPSAVSAKSAAAAPAASAPAAPVALAPVAPAASAPAVAVPPPPPPPLTAHPLKAPWPRRLPSVTPRATRLIAGAYEAMEPAPAVAPSLVPPPAVAAAIAAPATATATAAPASKIANAAALPAPSNKVGGGLSIARQLGLGVSRIVIDAGHGGHDPGAKGKGVTEAELVLDVALRLEALLKKVPGVDTILTRRTDDFIPLPERTAIANREGADLFLSIHANASPNPQARGVETYFLNFANNVSAAAVAARENAASTLAMGEMPDIVKAIAMSNKLDESRDFATHVQRAMSEKLRASNRTLKDLGVKQAPFVVLIGATMPAVLAEISFVTNPQEARLLKSSAYRQKIAESLFNAIRKYQTSLKATSAVALQ